MYDLFVLNDHVVKDVLDLVVKDDQIKEMVLKDRGPDSQKEILSFILQLL